MKEYDCNLHTHVDRRGFGPLITTKMLKEIIDNKNSPNIKQIYNENNYEMPIFTNVIDKIPK